MEHLCFSQNRKEVVYDPAESHVATHFADTPVLQSVVVEALSNTNIKDSNLFFEYELGRVVGMCDLVETTAADEIVFAKRANRDIYTRFTKSQQPQDCSTVTISLEKLDGQTYTLWSAWIGYIGPAFPGDANETLDSIAYWSRHALIWGRQAVQPGTETKESPW